MLTGYVRRFDIYLMRSANRMRELLDNFELYPERRDYLAEALFIGCKTLRFLETNEEFRDFTNSIDAKVDRFRKTIVMIGEQDSYFREFLDFERELLIKSGFHERLVDDVITYSSYGREHISNIISPTNRLTFGGEDENSLIYKVKELRQFACKKSALYENSSISIEQQGEFNTQLDELEKYLNSLQEVRETRIRNSGVRMTPSLDEANKNVIDQQAEIIELLKEQVKISKRQESRSEEQLREDSDNTGRLIVFVSGIALAGVNGAAVAASLGIAAPITAASASFGAGIAKTAFEKIVL